MHQLAILLHHPPYLEDEEEGAGYFNLPQPSRGRLLDLLADSGVRLLMAGHLHRSHDLSRGSMDIAVAGPVGMPLGEGCSGLGVFRVQGRDWRYRFFALDDAAGRRRFLAD